MLENDLNFFTSSFPYSLAIDRPEQLSKALVLHPVAKTDLSNSDSFKNTASTKLLLNHLFFHVGLVRRFDFVWLDTSNVPRYRLI